MTCRLLDSGPLIAFLDTADPNHERCADMLEAFDGQLRKTSAVIVEVMHFVQDTVGGPDALVRFLRQSQTQIHECTDLPDLELAAFLMRKYADTPMDVADATLVLLAQQTDVADILTLDRRGFSTFRFNGHERFRLVLPAGE
jgi:hypothetical protein